MKRLVFFAISVIFSTKLYANTKKTCVFCAFIVVKVHVFCASIRVKSKWTIENFFQLYHGENKLYGVYPIQDQHA